MDAVGLLKLYSCRLRWLVWAPLSSSLDQWYSIAPSLILYANEDGDSFTSYEHIFFLVDGDTILGEDGNITIGIGRLPTLIRDVWNSSEESELAAFLESCGNGSSVSQLPWHVPALVTPTCFVDFRNIDIPTFNLSSLLT